MVDGVHNAERPVIFLAPGSGLGHLVRTGALALELARQEIPSLIISSSPWAQGFARISGCRVVKVPAPHWQTGIVPLVQRMQPRLLVLDSFPLGFRGEPVACWSGLCPVVYLARRLRFAGYRHALKGFGNSSFITDMTTLVIEPLADDHQAWIDEHTAERFYLANRICFPWSTIQVPEVPAVLAQDLERNRVYLVVHSGPEAEVRCLMELARQDMSSAACGRLAVINPILAGRNEPGCYDYFPAASLFSRAYKIYTGAGYNAVAEGGAYAGKYSATPFSRHYDDQQWRAGEVSRNHYEFGRGQAVDIFKPLFNGFPAWG